VYLINLQAKQIAPAVGPMCRVLVEWKYWDQLPDVVQLSYRPDGGSNWYELAWPEVESFTDPLSAEVDLPAAAIGTVRACPRMLDENGVLEDQQPDDWRVDRYWETFCLFSRLVTEGREDPRPSGCVFAPEITGTDVGFGMITVHWTDPGDYDAFEVEWRDGVLATASSAPFIHTTEDQHFVVERAMGGRTYSFRVRGVQVGISKDCRSDWSRWVDVLMPVELGYVPARFDGRTSLAALSRSPDHMDVFAIGEDGVVKSTWWNGNPWHMWFRVGRADFPPHTPITALSRDSDFMDLFAVQADGRVNTASWNANPWRQWEPIGESLFEPGTPVAAVSRHSDFMDLFAVGRDGQVRQAWWNGIPWRAWSTIDGATFASRTPVAALSRNDDHMEVFAVDDGGVVCGNWWDGGWHEWFSLHGEVFPQQTPVAAISRDDDHMDVFAVGGDGVIRANSWDGSWHGWYALDGALFEPRAPIASLTRNDGHMELWAVDTERAVRGRWWGGTWHGWYALETGRHELEFFEPIAAISRNAVNMDVFVISRRPGEEFVWSDWWGWRKWFSIP
jgi:hypothetical protein